MTIQRAGGEKIMREIKFRAWDKKQQKFVDDKQIKKNFNQYYKQPNSVIMQFTGLKDKNGKEIYEGDICKYWMDSVWKYGYVFWNQGGFALKVFRMGEKTVDVVFKFQTFIPVPDDGETMTDQFEVIGNIYDNPELLEGVAR
jgi:uncharacterized phage protein (TIGR01671 family)